MDKERIDLNNCDWIRLITVIVASENGIDSHPKRMVGIATAVHKVEASIVQSGPFLAIFKHAP